MARHAHGTLTQAQHAARTRACSCPASPFCRTRARPRLCPLTQGTARLRLRDQLRRECSRSVPWPWRGSPPCRAEPGLQGQGQATGKLGFPGDLLSVSIRHSTTAPSRAAAGFSAAAPPWEDPGSTQVLRHPAQLSPDSSSEGLVLIPSPALLQHAPLGLLQTPEQLQLRYVPPHHRREPDTPKESAAASAPRPCPCSSLARVHAPCE